MALPFRDVRTIIGRERHMQVRDAWLEPHVADGELELETADALELSVIDEFLTEPESKRHHRDLDSEPKPVRITKIFKEALRAHVLDVFQAAQLAC